mmetsp:Transcript_96385/g.274722  ORF Transcript_96385/g.274722 Transcript_96385/m.274722 type:complete len:346 (-) Transcript_96385:762-1799(-)
MVGTKENLQSRIAKCASHIMRDASFSINEVKGALVIYCGGCMLAIKDEMDIPCHNLSRALGGAPFLGHHTFGEQGSFPNKTSAHGNLMFSTLVFSNKLRQARIVNSRTGAVLMEGTKDYDHVVNEGKSRTFSMTGAVQSNSPEKRFLTTQLFRSIIEEDESEYSDNSGDDTSGEYAARMLYTELAKLKHDSKPTSSSVGTVYREDVYGLVEDITARLFPAFEASKRGDMLPKFLVQFFTSQIVEMKVLGNEAKSLLTDMSKSKPLTYQLSSKGIVPETLPARQDAAESSQFSHDQFAAGFNASSVLLEMMGQPDFKKQSPSELARIWAQQYFPGFDNDACREGRL